MTAPAAAEPFTTHPIVKKSILIPAAAAAILAAPHRAAAVLGVGDIVSDPVVEEATLQKNVFDQLKYAWEQTQWAEKLATLHNTLTTVQQQLETANQVKQAIGDPAAAIGLIDNGLFSDFLKDSGIGDTLGQLVDITQQGAELSGTIKQLFEPVDLSRWKDVSSDATKTFDGVASFRDSSDPLKRFRAVENAYSQFQTLMGKAETKRKVLNEQVAKLNTQLKGAKNDAEVQKLVGSLATAQTALGDLDTVTRDAGQNVAMIHVLNENRQAEEEVAAEEISRERNRDLAKLAAQADLEAEANLPDLGAPLDDAPPGF